MTAEIINFTAYRDKRLRGKRVRTKATRQNPIEPAPVAPSASPAPSRLDNLMERVKARTKKRRDTLELST